MTVEGINRRLDGFEGFGRGFYLVRPAKSAPRSLLVNRFAVLNIEEVNTDICEPIDAPLPSAPDRKVLSWRPK